MRATQSTLNSEKGLWLTLFFCGLLLSISGLASFWLQPAFAITWVMMGVSLIAPLLFRWLAMNISLIGAVVILGVVFMTGFLGSFVDVIDLIAPIYTRVRWIAPLFALAFGLLQIGLSHNIWQAIQRPWGALSPALLLFLGYAVTSVPYSSAPITTLGRAVTFAAVSFGTGAALYYVVQRVEQAERILLCLALMMAIVIIPGELYIFFPNSIGWHSSGRFRSTFWNPVTFGHLCVLLMPLYWWLVVRVNAPLLQRIAATGMIGILLANLYLAGSRGAALALIVIVPLLAWYLIGRRARWLLMALSFLLFLVALPFQWATIVDFFTRGAEWTNNYQFYSGRLTSWQNALQLWSQSPIIGYGFGSIGNTDTVFLSADRVNATIRASNTAGLRLSNLYLEILGSGGTIGAGLFLFLLLSAFRILISAIKWSANPIGAGTDVTGQLSTVKVQSLLIMALATFTGGLVLNLTETWLISAGSPFAMYWWLVLFLAIRVAGKSRRQVDK